MSYEKYRQDCLDIMPATGIDGDQEAVILSAYISHLESKLSEAQNENAELKAKLEEMILKTNIIKEEN